MRVFLTTLLLVAISQSSAFVSPVGQQNAVNVASDSQLSMGLFDFFSEEAKQAREEKRRREIAEQEEMQRQILERRRNPEAMEEYEARVSVRRKLYMSGRDDLAKDFKVTKDDKSSES